jgi:hypothetical protein
MAAIFKDEARFLHDWLTFHVTVGVEHFYLYNNESSDDYQTILRPWIARGLVTLTEWPGQAAQKAAYRDCIRRARSKAKWIAFVDLDEFLFSPKRMDIRPLLRPFADLPGVFVYPHRFGSSGHESRPNASVLTAYTRRAKETIPASGKSIVNPRLVRDPANPHFFKMWIGEARDELRRPVPFYFSTTKDHANSYEVLRINHYWSRSLEDLREKVTRGDALLGGTTRNLAEHLVWEKDMNAIEDREVIPLWAKITEAADDLVRRQQQKEGSDAQRS